MVVSIKRYPTVAYHDMIYEMKSLKRNLLNYVDLLEYMWISNVIFFRFIDKLKKYFFILDYS